jgi:adenosylcobyric acid synthase
LLDSFGIAGGGENYRQSVDRALDDVAGELEAVLDPKWLDQLMS